MTIGQNISGRRAAEVFMELTEEHKVLRPIKRAKIHKSHTKSRRRSIACEKIVLPILVAWVVRTESRGQNSGREVVTEAMRQQRRDVSPKYLKTQRGRTCFFSGVSHRQFARKFMADPGAQCTSEGEGAKTGQKPYHACDN